MKKLLTAGLLLFGMIACSNTSDETVDGEKIYKTYCVACHGRYGDHGASGAVNLQQSILDLEARIEVIAKGRNLMQSFEMLLDPEEINAVAEYTMSLKPNDE